MKKKPGITSAGLMRKFKKMQMVHLATVDGVKPRLRPVTLLKFGGKLWVVTGSKDDKITQIRKNKNIEFCLLLPTEKNMGYIRGRGTANIIKDKKTRIEIAKKTPFYKMFWQDYNDPRYTLLEIKLTDADYMKPGQMFPEKVKM